MIKKLFFTHGWATDNCVWNDYIDTLPRDYEIYNPNLPGHGRGNATLWSTSTLTPAVELITEILALAPSGPPIGIGWSLGALSIMKTEIERPGSFRALILVGATPSFVSNKGFPWGVKLALVRRMRADIVIDPQGTLKRFYQLNFTGAELASLKGGVSSFLDRYAGTDAGFHLISLANALETLYNTNITDKLALLGLPVLIIHGSRDSVTPMAAAKYLDEHIRDSRLFVIDNAGHAPFITEPERFSSIAHDFISEIFSNQ